MSQREKQNREKPLNKEESEDFLRQLQTVIMRAIQRKTLQKFLSGKIQNSCWVKKNNAEK